MRKSRVLWVVLFLMVFALTVFGGDKSEAEAGAASARTVLKVAVSNFAWRLDQAVKWSNNTAQMHINMHDRGISVKPRFSARSECR